MILSWEADGMAYDEHFISDVAEKLGLSEDAVQESDDAIESKRGNGGWGGQRNKVLEHAMTRVESAIAADILPVDGPIAEVVKGLLKRFRGGGEPADALTAFFDDDEGSNDIESETTSNQTSDATSESKNNLESRDKDSSDSPEKTLVKDGPTFTNSLENETTIVSDSTIEGTDEVDPFEELGVTNRTTSGNGNDSTSDAVSALLDDSSKAPEGAKGDLLFELMEEGGKESNILAGSEQTIEVETVEETVEEIVEENVQGESGKKTPSSNIRSEKNLSGAIEMTGPSVDEAYTMLLRTVWVDGILDPAEVQLLARKRAELGITFEHHLELVRAVIG